MAVPKRKVSKARRDKRRSQVWKLSAPAFSRCPQCGELKLPHRVCGNCGYYKGKEVIAVKRRNACSRKHCGSMSEMTYCLFVYPIRRKYV